MFIHGREKRPEAEGGEAALAAGGSAGITKRGPDMMMETRGDAAAIGMSRESARDALIGKLWRAAEKRAVAIEQRISAAAEDDIEGVERDAKVLASLARTMRELIVLEQAAAGAAKSTLTERDADDEPPRDIDAFRDALADRLESLRDNRAGDRNDRGAEPHLA
jgi:hypothetical protein